jgi:hypothetical protein
MGEITTLGSPKPVSPFYYRIIEADQGAGVMAYLPQRGVLAEDDKELWFNGVPEPAPTLELAKEWLHSMVRFDSCNTPGKVVWVLGVSL